jgi:hypothetical protein
MTHALFRHGFDIPLRAVEDYESARISLEMALKPLGVELIPCRTNLHAFTEGRVFWLFAFGPVVISTALTLGKLFKRFIIPPSFSYSELMPWGSTPITDHLFSTETMDIVHFGAGKKKLDRMTSIAHWEPAQQSLRVCIDEHRRSGVQNCCRCKKCLLTLTMIKLTGEPSDFTTFKKRFSLFDILRWFPHYQLRSGYAAKLNRYAWKKRKYAIILFMFIVSLGGILRAFMITLMPKKFFRWLKRRLYPLEKNAFATLNLPEED